MLPSGGMHISLCEFIAILRRTRLTGTPARRSGCRISFFSRPSIDVCGLDRYRHCLGSPCDLGTRSASDPGREGWRHAWLAVRAHLPFRTSCLCHGGTSWPTTDLAKLLSILTSSGNHHREALGPWFERSGAISNCEKGPMVYLPGCQPASNLIRHNRLRFATRADGVRRHAASVTEFPRPMEKGANDRVASPSGVAAGGINGRRSSFQAEDRPQLALSAFKLCSSGGRSFWNVFQTRTQSTLSYPCTSRWRIPVSRPRNIGVADAKVAGQPGCRFAKYDDLA